MPRTPRCWSNGEGPGRLAGLQPARGGQRHGRRDARRARGGLAGARRGPRRARHRQHRGRAAPSRPGSTSSSWPASPRRCASSPGARGAAELRMTAWHNGVWKPVIAAVNGVCAGGGLHFVADADIVIAVVRRHRSSIRTCRSGQVTAYEAIGLARKIPVEAVMRMALVGRHERHLGRRAPSRSAWSARWSTRPSACATRRRPWPRRSPATRRPPWRPPSGPCGARSRPG